MSPTAISGVPTGPAGFLGDMRQSQTATEAIAQNREVSAKASAESPAQQMYINDKYFIVKSLTAEDLEFSVRSGIWATQGHNEEALNKAFKVCVSPSSVVNRLILLQTVENVFLIFSANKSGEYFGYARMASPINDEVAKDLQWKPHTEVMSNDPDLPRSIPTSATEFAPPGRIIDDSARGTIFWEADPQQHDESQEVQVDGEIGDVESKEEDPTGLGDAGDDSRSFGRPFKINWISTTRLHFFRTRGIRNPWNANREIKIARDGTELETSVGRRLIAMFHSGPAQQSPFMPGPSGHGYGVPVYEGGPY